LAWDKPLLLFIVLHTPDFDQYDFMKTKAMAMTMKRHDSYMLKRHQAH